jgi:hypothetical protein
MNKTGLNIRWWGAGLLCSMACWLGACSSPSMKVQRMAVGPEEHGWELRGDSIFPLMAQAQRLCPAGFDVLHRWERRTPAQDPDSLLSQVRHHAFANLTYNNPAADARLSVSCKPFGDAVNHPTASVAPLGVSRSEAPPPAMLRPMALGDEAPVWAPLAPVQAMPLSPMPQAQGSLPGMAMPAAAGPVPSLQADPEGAAPPRLLLDP